MPKKSAVTDRPVLRRKVLTAAFATAAAWFARGAMRPARAGEQKMSKKEAEYQVSPKDIRMCATCTLFEPPKSCKVVEGDISPNGWCKAFALAD
jgi:hypothetical protein